MANRRGRREVLQTLDDRELLRRYRLDRAGIMFVVDLLRDAITSPTRRHNAITPEAKVITTLRYLATGKMQQCSSDYLGLSQVITEFLECEILFTITVSIRLECIIMFIDLRVHPLLIMTKSSFPSNL